MEIESSKIQALKEIIVTDRSLEIVVLGHTNPDGDAIGAALAWGEILEKNGHNATCIVLNKYPYFLSWMPGIRKLRIYKEDKTGQLAKTIRNADIIFCMDFNCPDRLEGMSEIIAANKKAKFVLIDHHLDPPGDFYLSFSYPCMSSTSFLVYKIIEAMGYLDDITEQMGECLYVGMMTDTGNFSFSNLSSDLFRAVAVLVDKGINIPYINSSVYNSFTSDRVKLLGYALNKMEILNVGNLKAAYIALTEAELHKFKFQQGDSEGFVNHPLTIHDLSVSAMFLETRNFIRVSLRSRGLIDVSRFANLYFQGGGHKNAAGGKSYVSMEETISYYRRSITEYLREFYPEQTGE